MAENDTYWSVVSTGPDVLEYWVDGTKTITLAGTGPATANDTYHIVLGTDPDILEYYVNGVKIVTQAE